MISRNDFTGDKLKTKPASKEYRDGWDAIFGDWERTKDGDLIAPTKKEKTNDREIQKSK